MGILVMHSNIKVTDSLSAKGVLVDSLPSKTNLNNFFLSGLTDRNMIT